MFQRKWPSVVVSGRGNGLAVPRHRDIPTITPFVSPGVLRPDVTHVWYLAASGAFALSQLFPQDYGAAATQHTQGTDWILSSFYLHRGLG